MDQVAPSILDWIQVGRFRWPVSNMELMIQKPSAGGSRSVYWTVVLLKNSIPINDTKN